ncbi:MAG: hypothetical protein IKZ04_00100 [Spirochaetaceae bacterium]|nr:hypothetical protein [Spirochaetaceae bacterium]
MEKQESYFDGGLLQFIGWSFLGFLVSTCTLGICFPWAIVMIYRWKTEHTVINGKRQKFDGTGLQLLGSWIKWLLLTIITFGIFGFWVPIKIMAWTTKHTSFVDTVSDNNSNSVSSSVKTDRASPKVTTPLTATEKLAFQNGNNWVCRKCGETNANGAALCRSCGK